MDQRKNDGLRHLIPFLTRQKSKLLFLFLMALFNAVLTLMPIQLIALMVDLMTGSSHPMMRIPGLNHVYGAFLALFWFTRSHDVWKMFTPTAVPNSRTM